MKRAYHSNLNVHKKITASPFSPQEIELVSRKIDSETRQQSPFLSGAGVWFGFVSVDMCSILC